VVELDWNRRHPRYGYRPAMMRQAANFLKNIPITPRRNLPGGGEIRSGEVIGITPLGFIKENQ
jgi:hypothetical protein